MRILGIDPGLRRLGWGVIDIAGSHVTHVANGHCASGSGTLAERLARLHGALSAVIARLRPDHAAVEETFVNRDPAGALRLGQARGIALLAPAQAGLDVGEYAPNTIKKTVVGAGHAGKAQIGHMMQVYFPGAAVDGPDAADALAVALCHGRHLQTTGRLEAAARRARP